MVVNITISNKVVYLLVGLLILVGVTGIAIAVVGDAPNPGHAINEIQKCAANEVLKMNAAGDDWECASDAAGTGSGRVVGGGYDITPSYNLNIMIASVPCEAWGQAKCCYPTNENLCSPSYYQTHIYCTNGAIKRKVGQLPSSFNLEGDPVTGGGIYVCVTP